VTNVSTPTHTNDGRVTHQPLAEGPVAGTPRGLLAAGDLELARVFTDTVLRYLLRILPQVNRELSHWRTRAAEIPNEQLRRTAAEALAKRGNIEGAALFATLAPAAHHRRTVRALVAFQTAYNYLDALSELPSEDPVVNGEQLHRALLSALHPGAPHPDYYAHNPGRGDGGYLTAIRQLLAGGASLAVVGLAWPVLVTLTPAADRPWISGTSDNSIWSLIFSYNGVGRIAGQTGGAAGPGGGGGGLFGGSTGIFRLLQSSLGDQAGWLLGFAVVVGAGLAGGPLAA